MYKKTKVIHRKTLFALVFLPLIMTFTCGIQYASADVGDGITIGDGFTEDGDVLPTPTPSPSPTTAPVSSNVTTSAQLMASLLVIAGILGGLKMVADGSAEEDMGDGGSLLGGRVGIILGVVLAIAFLLIMAVLFARWGL